MPGEKEILMKSEQEKNDKHLKMGASLPPEENMGKSILNFLKQALEKKAFDALLIPMKKPESEAYSWVLLKDESLLDSADPLPPVMTVQGAKALSSITKHGDIEGQVAALMRPCEIRAALELSKLKQIDLDNVFLISLDCPGAVPLSGYMDAPKKSSDAFKEAFLNWETSDSLRPVCRICDRFSLPSLFPASSESSTQQDESVALSSDLHIGLVGGKNDILLIPVTSKGKDFLDHMNQKTENSLENWKSKVKEIWNQKSKEREKANREFLKKIEGPENFPAVFDACMNCHNCMSVCPVCYCQQCYFDSQTLKLSPEDYLERAEKRGALRFPLDTLFFHLGRMSHMLLSCVSCGACEDACPMSIPVAQVFTALGDRTQDDFKYIPGRDRAESLPLQVFLENEFCEVEIPSECKEPLTAEAEKNV
jgi:formate dehydrogenase subunit beta